MAKHDKFEIDVSLKNGEMVFDRDDPLYPYEGDSVIWHAKSGLKLTNIKFFLQSGKTQQDNYPNYTLVYSNNGKKLTATDNKDEAVTYYYTLSAEKGGMTYKKDPELRNRKR